MRGLEVSGKLRVVVALTALFVLAGTAAGQAGGKAKGDSFHPPYKAGPSGGDSSNFVWSDPATGRAMLLRAYPVPGAFNCGGQGGWTTFQVKSDVTHPVSAVVLQYEDALVDSYTWITAVAHDSHGEWLGSREVRGPITGTGKLVVKLGNRSPSTGQIVFDFGLQVASACPNVNGGTASFPSVTFSHA